MILHSAAKPVGKVIEPGELLLMRRNGSPIPMIALESPAGQQLALVLQTGDEIISMRRKFLTPSANWATFGKDWVLELRPGAALGARHSDLVEHPGVISYSSAMGPLIAARNEGFDALHFSLTTWAAVETIDYDSQVFTSWAIWCNEEDRLRAGAVPIYDTQKGYLWSA